MRRWWDTEVAQRSLLLSSVHCRHLSRLVYLSTSTGSLFTSAAVYIVLRCPDTVCPYLLCPGGSFASVRPHSRADHSLGQEPVYSALTQWVHLCTRFTRRGTVCAWTENAESGNDSWITRSRVIHWPDSWTSCFLSWKGRWCEDHHVWKMIHETWSFGLGRCSNLTFDFEEQRCR